MQTLVEGQTLLHNGRYRFLRRIGSGTFAVIIRALDVQQQCHVAIKCMRQQEFNALGEHEASTLRRINEVDFHASCAVVRLIETFKEQGLFCLVLELLGPPVLNVECWGPWRQAPEAVRAPDWTIKLFKRDRKLVSDAMTIQSPDTQYKEKMCSVFSTAQPLTLTEIRQMAVHLCGALAFLHDQGLIHADVKPENVVRTSAKAHMLSSSLLLPCSSPVKFIDFGNCLDSSELAAHTAECKSGGFDVQTVTYRAPEVAAGLLLCPAMDMWSLGCLLIECVSGKPLFMLSALETSAHKRMDVTKHENDHLLNQIECIVMHGIPLETACAPYQSAERYKKKTKIAVNNSVSTLLQARLEAAAPEANQFQDFIFSLLDVNPCTRITAKRALCHPFLQAFFPFKTVFGQMNDGQDDRSGAAILYTTTACTNCKEKRSRSHETEVQGKSVPVRKKKSAMRAVLARNKDLRQVLKQIPRDVPSHFSLSPR
ncbi:putative protein kinase [Plasmopara halstedii]